MLFQYEDSPAHSVRPQVGICKNIFGVNHQLWADYLPPLSLTSCVETWQHWPGGTWNQLFEKPPQVLSTLLSAHRLSPAALQGHAQRVNLFSRRAESYVDIRSETFSSENRWPVTPSNFTKTERSTGSLCSWQMRIHILGSVLYPCSVFTRWWNQTREKWEDGGYSSFWIFPAEVTIFHDLNGFQV